MTVSRTPAALAVAAVLLLAGCAPQTSPGSAPAVPVDVMGQGTVLQVGDAAPQFCLGAVLTSYPPQCSGPELTGWDWETIEGDETADGTTWGAYAVWGSWDGSGLTVTDAVQLALYDPMPVDDPQMDPENAGTAGQEALDAAQEALPDEAPVEILSANQVNGYVVGSVVFDDGSVQKWADSRFGAGVVLIRPQLTAVTEG